MRKIFIIAATVIAFCNATAQVKVGSNPNTIDDRSILELESNGLGVLLTRLTMAQRDAQTGWQVGHLIFNVTDSCFQFYNGVSWECVTSTSKSMSVIELPRRDSTSIVGISNVVRGTIVYNTTKRCLQYYSASGWVCIDPSALRQATGGGGKADLLENCGCGDAVTVVGGTSSSPTNLATAMNSYCGIICATGNSGSNTHYFRLPNPASYAGKFFCMRNQINGTASTTIYFLTPTGMSNPTNRLASLHWKKDLKDTNIVGQIFIEDPSKSNMMLMKWFSNGTYWFMATGY